MKNSTKDNIAYIIIGIVISFTIVFLLAMIFGAEKNIAAMGEYKEIKNFGIVYDPFIK